MHDTISRPTDLDQALGRIRDLETNLREVHHRIKNQLQMVSGMLNLHAMGADTPQCEAHLRKAMGCVACVADLHEQLSLTTGTPDCADYFQALAISLRRSYALPASVTLETHAPFKAMDATLLSAAGMVVCELVANAARHAFPGGRKGHVTVDLVPGRHTLAIIVQDDGVGLPGDMDPMTGGGLGFDIVRNTVGQWHGRMAVSSDANGTTVTVSLAVPH